jgi:hypothetical protein
MNAPGTSDPDEKLSDTTPSELIRLLIRGEDRVERALIDECARRGGAMLDELAAILDKDYYWGEDLGQGEWWLRLHAVMILGLMPEERAGELLVQYMRRMDEARDGELQEWLDGYWPALFRNKPAAVAAALKALGKDRERGWQMRVPAIDAVIAKAEATGSDALEDALLWASSIAFDNDEQFDVRTLVGSTLLDFARPEHRADLDALADLQPHIGRMFDRQEIEDAYARGGETPEWEQKQFADPWAFYTAVEIGKRQLRWAEDAIREEEALLETERGEPYVREGPKIGRNDPCPCGSGKKYKKCCMPQ